MQIKDMMVGETYNFSTIDPLRNLGVSHKSLRYIENILFKSAIKKADVYTEFYSFANRVGIDLERSKFLVFETLDLVEIVIPKEFIVESSPELTLTYPAKVDVYELDNEAVDSLRYLLSSNGFNFKITNM